MRKIYIVQLEEGVWLADTEGDPGRTPVKENAFRFHSREFAALMIHHARKNRRFESARIEEITQQN